MSVDGWGVSSESRVAAGLAVARAARDCLTGRRSTHPRRRDHSGSTSRRLAVALAALLVAPAGAAAHTIPGLVHDARDVVLIQAPGAHAAIAADGAHLELRRSGANVVEVLDPQGRSALRLDARGAWARRDAPILSVLSVDTGAPDPRDPAWLRVGHGASLRFHYPGTHGAVLQRWRVPLLVDGRRVAILGAVESVGRPSLAWPVGTVAAVAAAAGLMLALASRRRVVYLVFGALAVAAVVVPYGESEATSARPWGAFVAGVVALVGLAAAIRLRRDPALERGALAVTAVVLALPLVGRLGVLRHGVIVTTLDAGLERALVAGGLALAAAVVASAGRAWWPTSERADVTPTR